MKAKIPGHIYILSSPAMPDLLKNGYTARPVETRAVELADATGVPRAFVIEYSKSIENAEFMEGVVHGLLAGASPSANREFFFISVSEAVRVVDAACAGKRPSGSVSPRPAALPPGWRPPTVPAARLPSARAGQIQPGVSAALLAPRARRGVHA